MKKFSLLALSVFFVSMAAISAFAQPGAGKIGWISMGAFDDDKLGIKKLVNAGNAIDLEFKPRVSELQSLAVRINTLKDELGKMNAASQNPAIPFDPKAAAAKQEEVDRLTREGEFKQKELQAAIDKRKEALIGPIMDDIGKAMDEYAKQKGFAVILDPSKLFQAGVLLSFDQTVDTTKDFITFYNARPGTTAGTTAPAKP